MTRQTAHTLLLAFTALIWGMAFVAQSAGGALGPFTFLACRSWVGLAVLLPTLGFFEAARRKAGRPAGLPQTRAAKNALLAGGAACGTALCAASAAQQAAITLDPSTAKAGFITAMYVVLVPVFGRLLGCRCGAQVWLCVLVSVAGLYLLCMKNGFGSIGPSDGLLLACAALFSVQILLINHFSPQVDGLWLSCMQFFVVAVQSTVCMFALEQPSWEAIAANAVPVLYCGVFSSGIAYTLQIIGQKDLDPAVASIVMCLESVFGALGGWLVLGQTLTLREGAGCALIFGAVVLAQLPLRRLLRMRKTA